MAGRQSDGQRQPTLWQRFVFRSLRRRAGKADAEPLSEEDWATFWAMQDTRPARMIRRFWTALPGTPRCGICAAPFAGAGAYVVRPLGYRPSRKNPTLCATCVEGSPPGGMKMQAGVLFADIRGFTSRSESMDPSEVSALLRRFYGSAERALFPEAVIDKLIGDEVMALFLPVFTAKFSDAVPAQLMLDAAVRLLEDVGYGTDEGPFAELGIGLDYGEAFVGNIGDRSVYDFTAVGDVVNTASRLQGNAGGGEVIYSERLAEFLSEPPGERIELELKGKAGSQPARRLSVG